MAAEIEAMGDLATGAILASVVEPQTGDAAQLDESKCLNCGALLTTPYCGQCGQKAKIHRSLSAFWHDLVHSVFHFDGKIWRTLPMLAFKPGHLTRRYVHGERASFVSPLALFLFTVFLMFAAFNLVGAGDLAQKTNANTVAGIEAELAADKADYAKKRDDDQAELVQAQKDGRNADDIVARMAERKQAFAERKQKATQELAKREATERAFSIRKREPQANIARLENEIAAAEKAKQTATALRERLDSERAELRLIEAAQQAVLNPDMKINARHDPIGIAPFDRAIEHALENPPLFFYKIQAGAYKYSWALILLSTPFVWLLFAFRRDVKMFDHAVFATYSICFMMLLFTAGALAVNSAFLATFAKFVMTIVPPVHMYKQLKYAYGLSRFGAIWRTITMSTFVLIVLVIFASIVVALGAIG
jgi:hypothetical protein